MPNFMPADEKLIEEAGKTARHYLDQILVEPLSELGLLAKDRISAWRFKNQVNQILKTKEFLEQRGVDPMVLIDGGKLSPDVIVPILEAGSNTNDPDLSHLFAGLLANAIDPSGRETVHPSFAGVLAQISGHDAQILKMLYDRKRAIQTGSELFSPIPYDELGQTLGLTGHALALANSNLDRLGITQLHGDSTNTEMSLSHFGISLLIACLGSIPVKNDRVTLSPS
tara:strand:- start:2659 stop:3336 length:678 start_codon:yes stop_codon:yes gene_type:complete